LLPPLPHLAMLLRMPQQGQKAHLRAQQLRLTADRQSRETLLLHSISSINTNHTDIIHTSPLQKMPLETVPDLQMEALKGYPCVARQDSQERGQVPSVLSCVKFSLEMCLHIERMQIMEVVKLLRRSMKIMKCLIGMGMLGVGV
jgi:hypothetical protein